MVNQQVVVQTPYRKRKRVSWVDWILDRIDRIPAPLLVPYAFLFLTPTLLIAAPVWLSGRGVPLETLRFYALTGFWTLFPLALMHHLDKLSEQALEQFRPVCDMDEAEASAIRWDLTTMPSGPAAAAGMAGIGVVLLLVFIAPQLFQVVQSTSTQFAFALVILSLNFAFQATLIYHTVRQLNLVSRVYARISRLDLFNLSPLYAFAGLAARTAIAWGLALYLTTVVFPEGQRNTVTFGLTILQLVLLLAAFTLPLLGIHERIRSAKDEALRQVGASLYRTVQELNQRTNPFRLEDVDALGRMIAALTTGRDIISKVPTWPWNPGTPVAVASTLLLPVILFVIERLLAGILGL